MSEGQKLVECVPNFSTGRDEVVADKIAAAFRKRSGVRLLDVQRDADHNRMVVTAVGAPQPLAESAIAAVGTALECIDMRRHRGQHPRMGAADVVPFVPVRGLGMAETVTLARETAAAIAERFELPVYLYEAAATSAARRNLADVRRGEFEGLARKLADPDWKPDFGPPRPHPTAGAVAVGARMPLVAFNVNLGTDRIEVADAVARRVRHISGGLRFCKAMGVELQARGIVQVSMNLTDFTRSALYQALELVRIEARRWGVAVVGSELVGLVPMAALVDTAVYYLGIEEFSSDQVLEARLLEE